jgi:hypothetical protein
MNIRSTGLLFSGLLISCTSIDELDPEELGEAAGEIGEAACRTRTANDNITVGVPGGLADSFSNTTYGHADCLQAWIVDVSSSPPSAFGDGFVRLTPIVPPVTQSTCINSRLKMEVYGVSQTGTPTSLTTTRVGVWNSSTSKCSLEATQGGFDLGTGATIRLTRVAAQLLRPDGSTGPIKIRVSSDD